MNKYELLSFPISVLVYLIWIIIRRTPKTSIKSRSAQRRRYSGVPRGLIIAGIIVFLFPCIVAVLHALSFPLLLGTSWLMTKLNVPNGAAATIRFAILTTVFSICFITAHRLCRPLWPSGPTDTEGSDALSSGDGEGFP